MFDHKIIITGAVGVGKSTAIRTYSTSAVVDTDVRATDETSQIKKDTTVAMDYGTITLDAETKVHLYGTPGQERFDFMWEILSKGSMGLAILINAAAPDPAADLRFYLNAFKGLIVDEQIPLVIGVNRIDKTNPHHSLEYFQEVADEFRDDIPVLMVDVREGRDVRRLVMTLLFTI